MLNKTSILTLLGTTVIALTLSACGNAETDSSHVKAPTAAVETVTSTVQLLSQGTFSGRSDHVTSGQVSLEKTATGYQLNFAADFFLDGAPDPIVALGNGETYLAANKVGALQHKSGPQIYQLPAGFTPGQFSEVYVWCEKFSVPLGIAQLTQN